MREKLKLLSKSWIGLILAISIGLILLASVFIIGKNSATIEIDNERLKYEDVTLLIKDSKEELNGIDSDIEREESKLWDKKSEIEEVLELVENKNEIVEEKDSVKDELGEVKSKVKGKKKTLKEKEKELDKLENIITKKEEEPTNLKSGVYIVGEDIEDGRYQASNIGRGTNFFVYNDIGETKVNTILGDSDIGSGDYIFFANDEDVIETSGEVNLTPVE